ncbi:hypothetical protein GobsT_08190 [Gemmata obscuriglobus]|uniref:Uncharacterized protein n=1 Tax=Gemmata obscuriglobus TaxID=114 RepID=A0A2Z3HFR9_9BACT|nr:hypothetical protein [Gemmata obscuriglobus]AWM40654.1 hypothetical protein C1280_29165 [Gemmata obscuriglobus]QEG26084.1 hypothetical protein GobsT_08190 [Gemmata obscuriglobus]VTS00535.1 unnamed protein product [Gemmata obscuriglobus UQM 2246]
MGRTLVVWAVCLVPVLTGCGALRHDAAPRSLFARDARREARTAWATVRDRHPDRVFSDEFRDGFIDGYAERRAHGPTPPAPGADVSAREYQLGYRYATETAVAPEPAAPRSAVPQNRPPVSAPAEPAPVALLPKPELPVIKPFDPPRPSDSGAKFAPLPVPDSLPTPVPALPSTLPVPAPDLQLPVPLPGPPLPSVPPLPSGTPTILDDIPPLPFVPPAVPRP